MLHDLFFLIGAVYTIPEWVSFQNKVRTAFTWNRTGQSKAFSPAWFARQIRYSYATRSRVPILRFSIRTKFSRYQWTWYKNEISYRTENFFGNENRNELILEYGNELSSWYHVNRYREIAWRWNELASEWKSYVSSPIEDKVGMS